MSGSSQRLHPWWPLALAVGVVAASTLWPMPGSPAITERWCLFCGDLGGVDFLNNVALFLPIGLVCRRRWSLPTTVGFGVFLSLGVEVLQWRVVAGRDASIGDLAANTLGALIGALVFSSWSLLQRPTSVVARRLTLASLFVFCLVWLGTGWAMQPMPTRWNHYLSILPQVPGRPPTDLRVSAVQLAGVPLGPFALVSPLRHGPDYVRGLVDLEANLTGVAPDQATVVLRIANPTETRVELTARARSITFRTLRNSARLKLRSAAITWPAVLDSNAAHAFRFVAADHSLRVTHATNAAPPVERSVSLTPARGWALLGPIEVHTPALASLLDGLWLSVLVFPVMYFARRRSPRMAWTALVGVLGVVVLSTSWIRAPSPAGTIGLLCGLLLGVWLARRSSDDLEPGGAHPEDRVGRVS